MEAQKLLEYSQQCQRELFRHMIEGCKKHGLGFKDAAALQVAFKALTGSLRRYIDPESAEGIAITQSINDANAIMESVRPPWVDSKNPRHKLKLSEIQGARQHLLSEPIMPQSTRPTSDSSTASDILIATQPPEPQTSEQRGSLTSSRTKSIEVASGPQSSPRRSARVSTYLTKPDVSMGGKTVSHSRTRRKGKEDLKASESKQPPSVQVKSFDSHEDDSLYTESTSSPSGGTIMEILQGYQLFQLAEMNAELVATQNRAKLLPYKFTNRVPQLPSEFHSKPLSLPLPTTDGLTIIERLIQLGESCHWFTQKSEHLWFYQRGLDESFSLTLLQAEPLLNIDELTNIFQNEDRNKGAGFCSRSLMDNVELMVRKMVDKGKHGDGPGVEEKMTFDPRELFESQHQPKFCSSVEVTLRPYRGTNYISIWRNIFGKYLYSCFIEG